jgi:oxygen-independent coproporphyrinogen-3 oxidase
MDWRATQDNPVQHIYIHIPFCHRRCAYCDFNTYANMDDRMDAYVSSLCKEIASFPSLSKQQAKKSPAELAPIRSDLRPTIFLGGGTPSMLPLPLMEQILTAVDRIIPVAQAEVTVEANPGTVLGSDYLRGLRSLGVNRLSMGVQSLHDPTLRVLGRIHTAAEARASYHDARRAGFDNINLDFIFGLPGQDLAQWDATLKEIVTWDVDHFSLYSLILEESTPLYAQVVGGRVTVPDDDETGQMYENAMQVFGAAGYGHYEISNWARTAPMAENSPSINRMFPGYACQHNLAYWFNADYLAAGAGAHGHLYPRRFADILKIDDYIKTIADGQSPIAETTDLEPRDLYAETMFMGLRLNAGVSYRHFLDRCGVDMREVYGTELDELEHDGLLERDDLGVRLTSHGRMIGNQAFIKFV